ncbi:hypothetical protein QYE76_007174 [Lolium multiflorum]|uniref:Transposase (putative) gypsy type domain-containing protein n=1 Tax=Lolium multiflorum TaxID=4521 RepID=A0AAD8RXB0_LOLMU|nr:hypothetical protein QYE76_007174 [Lolium multiflorum]
MEAESSKDQEVGTSSRAPGKDLSGITRGAWRGSDVTQYEIDWLYRSRRIPDGVSCRLPGDETEPVLEPGEVVVFLAHFERGFGLPASDFFRQFLDFYRLQPHHLPGNAVFYLSCFVAFMEGYIGIRPARETFARFFSLRINSVQGKDIPKPKPPYNAGLTTFFYVKNKSATDLINLPPFNPAPPAKVNWNYNPGTDHIETNRVVRFMLKLMKDTNICSDDIIRTFICRRVLPLKRRAHKISEMYGPGDPTKITGLPLSKADVVLKANQICQTDMPDDWEWGLRPLSSTNPPTKEARDRFPRIDSDQRGPCRKRPLDKFDPDPFIHWQDLKMGRTPASRLGKSPPEPAGCFFQFDPFLSFSLALSLAQNRRALPGLMEPQLLLSSVGCLVPLFSPPQGGHYRVGRTAPTSITARRKGSHLTSWSQDTGASNTGADDTVAGQAEPLVPPGERKKKKKQPSSSHSQTRAGPPCRPLCCQTLPSEPTGTTAANRQPRASAAKPKKTAADDPQGITIPQAQGVRGKAVDGSASTGSQPLVLHVGACRRCGPGKTFRPPGPDC